VYPAVAQRVDFDAVETAPFAVPREFSPESGAELLDLVERQVTIVLGTVSRPLGRRNHDRDEVGDEVGGEAQ